MRHEWMKGMAGSAVVLLVMLVGFTAGVAPGRASETEKTGQQTAAPEVAPGRASDETPGLELPPALKAKLQEQKEKQSYAIGVEAGRNFVRQKMDLDTDMVIKGMKDALMGAKLMMSDQEMLIALYNFSGNWKAKTEIARRLEGLDNKKAGEDFLAENKTREGVVTLPDGLQYKILKEGKGRKPSDADTIEVNLRGTLIDGTEFINTAGVPLIAKESDPLHFVVGLRKAIKLMPAGSRWQIFVPHNLAYGFRQAGAFIGQNSTLIYDVELIAIH